MSPVKGDRRFRRAQIRAEYRWGRRGGWSKQERKTRTCLLSRPWASRFPWANSRDRCATRHSQAYNARDRYLYRRCKNLSTGR